MHDTSVYGARTGVWALEKEKRKGGEKKEEGGFLYRVAEEGKECILSPYGLSEKGRIHTIAVLHLSDCKLP